MSNDPNPTQTPPAGPASTPATVLGLGAMGSVLAGALLDAGHPTTVWNRSPTRAEPLVARGATGAASVEAAVAAGKLIVVCLYDHASVHEVLDTVAGELSGRALVNLTTTTPNEARELADWAGRHDIDLLDGGIMATPDMIGGPGSAVLYSGSATVFDQYRGLLDRWGESTYLGADAGTASLYDLAMLAGMYTLFAGFMHGAAMVGSEGISASDFAERTAPFLAAMAEALPAIGARIDSGDYATSGEGDQSLVFSDQTRLVTATVEQGVNPAVVRPVHEMIQRQIAAGHGDEAFERIFEEMRSTR